MPSILWAPAGRPSSTGDSAGSTTTIWTPGLCRFSTVATPREEAAVPDAVNEGVDLALRLAPDLLAQRVVAGDAVLVVELVGPVGVRLPAQLAGGLDHVQDQLLGGEAALARDERQLRAERRHVVQLLLAERVGA